mgnify:CR=1 FL=1
MKLELRPRQDYTGTRHPFEVYVSREDFLREYRQDAQGYWREFSALLRGMERCTGARPESWRPEELEEIADILAARPDLGEEKPCLGYDFLPGTEGAGTPG